MEVRIVAAAHRHARATQALALLVLPGRCNLEDIHVSRPGWACGR